ncbi:MAG: hypothetical protein HYW50_00055 [Candidatus Diapherotrites archaeon]|nr:hypothetical protein [Candidatus Diapherotrites archaeon]
MKIILDYNKKMILPKTEKAVLMQEIIKRNKSIIPACDLQTFSELEDLVEATFDIEEVGGYKIGFSLALRYGLSKAVSTIREYTSKPIIYDHS